MKVTARFCNYPCVDVWSILTNADHVVTTNEHVSACMSNISGYIKIDLCINIADVSFNQHGVVSWQI